MGLRWPSWGKARWRDLNAGDKRTIYRRAWLPSRCSDHHTYWFKKLRIKQEWVNYRRGGGYWKTVEKLPVAKLEPIKALPVARIHEKD